MKYQSCSEFLLGDRLLAEVPFIIHSWAATCLRAATLSPGAVLSPTVPAIEPIHDLHMRFLGIPDLTMYLLKKGDNTEWDAALLPYLPRYI